LKLLYLSISSILYVLSFSPFNYKVFIFFSLAFLFHSLENLSIKNKIKAVIYFSLLCHLLGTSWINYSLINYGSLGHLLSYIITFLFALIISLPYVLIGLYKSISSNNCVVTNTAKVPFCKPHSNEMHFLCAIPDVQNFAT